MKKIIKKYPNLIYLCFFLFLVILHMCLKTGIYDDVYFSQFKIGDIKSFLELRYNMWSSRILIDASMIVFLNLPKICWSVMNSFFLSLIAKLISYFFSKDNLRNKILSIFVVMLSPFYLMSEAGWYATTINYLWPLACALISFIPIKNILLGKSEKKSMYIVYVLAILFACNQEQCCALVLGFYFLFNLYFLFIKKERRVFPIVCLGFSCLSILFIMMCPGNAIRVIEEAKSWFPTFENFNVIHKLILGIINGLAVLIFKYNLSFLLLVIVLFYFGFKEKKMIKKIVYSIPLLVLVSTLFLINYFNGFIKLNNLVLAWEKFTQPTLYFSFYSKTNVAILCLTILVVVSISYTLYDLWKKKKEKLENQLFLPILFIAGFLSVVILGFTPTIYASGQRTFFFFNYLIIMILFWIASNTEDKKINYLLYVFGIIEILNVLALTF